MAIRTINEIWRDFEVSGNPASGAHKPIKADIRDTLNNMLAADTEPLIIVASGQSNMALPEKNAADTAFTIRTPQPNFKVWNNPDFADASAAGDTSSTDVGTAWITPPTDRWLVSMLMADELARMNPTRLVYLITVGYSGMAISHWLPGTSAPDVYAAIEGNVTPALAAIGASKVDVFLWWQGEADLNNATYLFNFQEMINRFYGSGSFSRTTQLIILSLGSNAQTGATLHDTFNEKLKRLAAKEPALRLFVDSGYVSTSCFDAFLHARLAGGYTQIGRTAAEQFTGAGSSARPPYTGLWTPRLFFGGSDAGVVYNTAFQKGVWSRSGQTVSFNGSIQTTTKPSATGVATIDGLPFTPVPESYGGVAMRLSGQVDTIGDACLFLNGSAKPLSFACRATSGGFVTQQFMDNTHFGNAILIYFSGTYTAVVDTLAAN